MSALNTFLTMQNRQRKAWGKPEIESQPSQEDIDDLYVRVDVQLSPEVLSGDGEIPFDEQEMAFLFYLDVLKGMRRKGWMPSAEMEFDSIPFEALGEVEEETDPWMSETLH